MKNINLIYFIKICDTYADLHTDTHLHQLYSFFYYIIYIKHFRCYYYFTVNIRTNYTMLILCFLNNCSDQATIISE